VTKTPTPTRVTRTTTRHHQSTSPTEMPCAAGCRDLSPHCERLASLCPAQSSSSSSSREALRSHLNLVAQLGSSSLSEEDSFLRPHLSGRCRCCDCSCPNQYVKTCSNLKTVYQNVVAAFCPKTCGICPSGSFWQRQMFAVLKMTLRD